MRLPLVSGGPAVQVVARESGAFTLVRDGQPCVIKGAGGSGHLELLRSLGGNAIRTWGAAELEQRVGGRNLLDRCADLGLGVMAGLWVAHERHGFDYGDPAQLARQRAEVRATVRKWRNHPALLLWGLGNEMEGPQADGSDPRIWRELEVLARLVKEEDPQHPVCTVIAGAGETKVRTLLAHYSSFEILGVNAYGGAETVGPSLRKAGYEGPFLLTEFGPLGHWEVAQTLWGAPLEPTSREKADRYLATHTAVMGEPAGKCLGTFCFIWGQKQETTATWYGMFLPDGAKTPAVDAMGYAWTGRWPAHRSPSIRSMNVPFGHQRVAPCSRFEVGAAVEAHGAETLSCEWLVVGESTDRKEGGDPEAAPPCYPDCVVASAGTAARLVLPRTAGAYRLFLYVRDGRGGGAADNVPFYIE
jgi:hypothetical protein